MTDEEKAFAVVSWLDDLRACAVRLADITALLEQMAANVDGLGAVRYDRPRVIRGAGNADPIGERLAEREEQAAALEAEAVELRAVIGNAARLIVAAWRANAGENDGHFRYVIEHYARGMEKRDAARVAGLGRYECALSARRVAGMIYESSPRTFAPKGGERFGYRQFMKGKA